MFLDLGSRPPFLPAGVVLVMSHWKHPVGRLRRRGPDVLNGLGRLRRRGPDVLNGLGRLRRRGPDVLNGLQDLSRSLITDPFGTPNRF